MADVTVMGLGDMGGALARALLAAGFDTAVWNRTASRADALVEAGARPAESPAAATRAADVILVCVDDYAAADSFLRIPETEAAFEGRALVQFSSGSPRQARQAQAWAEALGIHYVDGCIMAFPSEIAASDTTLVASGDEAGFRRAEPCLRALAGNPLYLGGDPGLAPTLDQALLSSVLGLTVGVVNGVVLCEAGGFPPAQFVEILGAFLGVAESQAQEVARTAVESRYRETEAALRTWAGAVEHMGETVRDAGVSDAFTRMLAGLFRRAIAAGHGEHDIAALVEVLRQPAAGR